MISLTVLLVFCVALASATSLPCSATIRGKGYNLQSIMHPNGTSADWVYKSSADNTTYYLNLCNNLVSRNPCGNDAPGYQYDPATGNCFRLGLLNAEWWGNSYFDTLGQDGVVVMYDEGDTCQGGYSRAKVSLLINCNPNVSTQLTSVVGIGQYCHWVAHFDSKYGCSL